MPGLTNIDAAILIVDDQRSNLRLIECVLRRAGYVGVSSTCESREVTALHRQNRYDLILLDLQMPYMSGYEVMAGLSKDGGKKPAILVLSADPSQMVPALEAGASGFLAKPFVLGDVALSVQLMLEKRASDKGGKRGMQAVEPRLSP